MLYSNTLTNMFSKIVLLTLLNPALYVHGKSLGDYERCGQLNNKFDLPGQLGKLHNYACSEICDELRDNSSRPVCRRDDPIIQETCSAWLDCMEGKTTKSRDDATTAPVTTAVTVVTETVGASGNSTATTIAIIALGCIVGLALLILVIRWLIRKYCQDVTCTPGKLKSAVQHGNGSNQGNNAPYVVYTPVPLTQKYDKYRGVPDTTDRIETAQILMVAHSPGGSTILSTDV